MDSSARETVSVGGFMTSESPQRAGYMFDFILLEQSDGGDSGRTRSQASRSIFQSDATERKNGNLYFADLLQNDQSCGE